MFVSEFPRIKGGRQHLPQLLRDRLAVAAHVEILGSLLTLEAPRVLEIRPRFGAIGAALRRLYGGETFALPLFEAQQVLVREAYGTCAEHLLDYDSFSIPYTGCFDLVVANHLLTHAVRPQRDARHHPSASGAGRSPLSVQRAGRSDFLETRQVDLQHAERVSSPDVRRRGAGARAPVRRLRAGVHRPPSRQLHRAGACRGGRRRLGSDLEEGAREARRQVRAGARPWHPRRFPSGCAGCSRPSGTPWCSARSPRSRSTSTATGISGY